jgi:branched-chain amino acid transport system permease protein
MTGQIVRITHMPVIAAMLLGGIAAMLVGIATGYPALKRRGLFLGLTTLSMGLLMYEAVFSLDTFRARGLRVPRPELFSGDRAFYFFELIWVVILLVLANNLRKGRLGRILGAMRDSEVATQSIGIELRTYKLFIFAVSAFIAGIGGALLGEQQRIFTADQFHPLQSSLLWFMVVVVAGVSSIWGAIIGGGAFVLLDVVAHRSGVSQLVIAIIALFIGYLPGRSLTGLIQSVWDALRHPRRLPRAFTDARRPPPSPPPVELEPSAFARRVLERSS